jgi:signal transduction histidine kinase
MARGLLPSTGRARLLIGVGSTVALALGLFCALAVRLVTDTALEASRLAALQAALSTAAALGSQELGTDEASRVLELALASGTCTSVALAAGDRALAHAGRTQERELDLTLAPGQTRTGGARVVAAIASGAHVRGTDGVLRAADRIVVVCLDERWTARSRALALVLWCGALAVLLVVLGLSSAALGRWFARPLEALSREFEAAAERVASSAPETPLERSTSVEAASGKGATEELVRLAAALGTFRTRIVEDRSRIESQLAALRSAHRELEQRTAQLLRSERLASVGILSAGIAHEIGNPLAIVLGYLEMLEQSDLPPEERTRAFEEMARATRRIDRVIRDLLAFARPERREDGQPADLPDVVARVVGLVGAHRKLRGVTVETRSVESLPESHHLVDISAAHLEQILVNLLINGADAMDGRGSLVLRASATGSDVVLDVRDEGPGVPMVDRERIFEPFYSTKATRDGTGLGLAISRQLAEAYGGRLEAVDPSPERGACLRLTLRRAALPS